MVLIMNMRARVCVFLRGMVLALLLQCDPITWRLLVAALLMGIGVWTS